MRALDPDARIVGVELDPGVVRLARRHFGLDRLGVELVIGDALEFLKRDRQRFDLIVEDLFVGPPRSVRKPEWLLADGYRLIRRRLRPGGYVTSNTIHEMPAIVRAMRRFGFRVGSLDIHGHWNRVAVTGRDLPPPRSLRRALAARAEPRASCRESVCGPASGVASVAPSRAERDGAAMILALPDLYEASGLRGFATALLERAGLAAEPARSVAEVLVEADLLGHDTHGLDMLARYLDEIAAGRMAREGEPETIRDSGAALTWDGRRLPGPWLVKRAIATARERLAAHPTVTVVIRRSHHIGCLQAYLKPVTDEGLVILLTCSDPSGAGVAPHGGVASRLTPNPFAAGFPTEGEPVLLDVSMSTTTNALTKRLYDEGERLPGPWLVDADGRASDDPGVLFREPKGALLPLGGLGPRPQGLRARAARRSPHLGPGRPRSRRRRGRLGRVGLPPAHRSRRFAGREAFVRERRGSPRSATRRPSRPESRRCACPASALWLVAKRSSRAASRSAPGSWSRSSRGRNVSASPCPRPA